MIDFEKLGKIQEWEKYEGETWEDVFNRKDIKPQDLPAQILIDVVSEIDLESWAKANNFESLEVLQKEIVEILKRALVEPINFNKKLQEKFPVIYNFCIYATKLNRQGKTVTEATKIAEQCWWGELATKRLNEKTSKIFNVEPDPEKYKAICTRIKAIWNFDCYDIEAFRYFVCQTRHTNHNPSMNKSLYLWSGKKQTGKTTLARTLASILNGGTSVLEGANYESSFNKEMQINDHDLPLAAQFNCVILDEAMPKDSRKSYGRVKSMLTSATCSYNQKFGRISTIPVKRYYIYTSNEDISDFIQDDSERRFIQIRMPKIPEQISFEEIYQIWLEFAQNCQPEDDWQLWYNTFKDVEGIERKEVDYLKTEIMNNETLHERIRFLNFYTLTMRFFEDFLIVGKPNREERDRLRKALQELFGEPLKYRWNKTKVLAVINSFESISSPEDDLLTPNQEVDIPF